MHFLFFLFLYQKEMLYTITFFFLAFPALINLFVIIIVALSISYMTTNKPYKVCGF